MGPIPDARTLLQAFGESARRSLGQNFLIDQNICESIARYAVARPGATVLEIGPGPGALTQALLRQGAHVHAIEKDRRAVAFLQEAFAEQPTFTVHEADALEYELPADARGWVAAGNLPYNVSTQIFFHLLPHRAQFSRWVFMFQREVAQRFVATPRTKAYGVLSVIAACYFDVRYVLTVPPGAFRPSPKVHGGVLLFEPREPRVSAELEHEFREVVRRAFGQRRKTLTNSLSGYSGLDKSRVSDVLLGLDIHPMARAEELDVQTFVALTAALVASTSP